MLHVLLVWILGTLHQISYTIASQQSSWGEYCLVHCMHAYLLTLHSNDAEYQFKV